MRVNARLDDASQEQLDYLARATGQSVSHVVREAVAHYYVQVRAQHQRPSRFLALAGRGDSGRSDIASNTKAFVADVLAAKHGKTGPVAK